MRRILYITLTFFIIQLSYAQEKIADENIYSLAVVDKKPVYEDGIEAFSKCISANIELPKTTEFKGGKVIVSFVINSDATTTEIKILKDPGFQTGEEVKRLLAICNHWIPGELNGKKVRVNYVLPITIPAYEPELVSEVIQDVVDTSKVYDGKMIEKIPEFPGGIEAFYRYVGRNFRTPMIEKLSGKIFLSFVIEKTGKVSNCKVIRDIGYGTGQEAIRVLMGCPDWIPGMHNGEPVRVLYSLPINIQANR
ncbi:energy transducer TonB [Flavobacterium sp.]|uniref:energy transducer TonB n=1 Tax=Flavobacterium sp. TaxID=239 RepID=UPI00260DCD50|nr:energy transducer TonB [Flavobacterium sp.]